MLLVIVILLLVCIPLIIAGKNKKVAATSAETFINKVEFIPDPLRIDDMFLQDEIPTSKIVSPQDDAAKQLDENLSKSVENKQSADSEST